MNRLEEFNEFVSRFGEKSERYKISLKDTLLLFSAYVYRNGLSENLDQNLVIRQSKTDSPTLTVRQIKEILEYSDSRRERTLAWICDIQREFAINHPEEGILSRVARRYNLDRELDQIPKEWRFYGADIHPLIEPENALRYFLLMLAILRKEQSDLISQKKENK